MAWPLIVEKRLDLGQYSDRRNGTATEEEVVGQNTLTPSAMSLYWGTMHLITDRLLVGSIDDAREPPTVIGTLLLVAEEFTIEPAGWVDYRRIPIKEFAEADPGTLLQAIEWLEQHVPESRVLVCCRAGMSRSVSVVMAYLCCVEGMTYADVLNLVMARRPGAMPLPNLQSAIEQVRLLRLAA